MVSYTNIDYEYDEGIAEIYFNRPEVKNAYNETLIAELIDALNRAYDDDSVYVIILSARGDAFCAGVDVNQELGEHGTEATRVEHGQWLWKLQYVERLMYRGPKPIVVAANGPALGGGFSLFVSSDIRVMSEDAWVCDQHLNIGVVPGPTSTWWLPQQIGWYKAKEAVFLGRRISAEEALDLGLITSVVPQDELMEEARNLAEQLKAKPAAALSKVKQLFGGPYTSFEDNGGDAMDFMMEVLSDTERDEAVAAHFEGREPNYNRDY